MPKPLVETIQRILLEAVDEVLPSVYEQYQLKAN